MSSKFLGVLFFAVSALATNTAKATRVVAENYQSSSVISSYPATMFAIQQNAFASLPSPSDHVNYTVNNTVLLYIDHSYPTYIPGNFDYTYEIELKLTDASLAVSTQVIYLQVQYKPGADPGVSYKDRVAYAFTGAHRIEAKVLNIRDQTGTSVANPEDNVILKSIIDIERYWDLSSTTSCVTSTSADLNSDGIKDELTLNWSTITGAESYDLEWTWVDDYDVTLSTPKAASAIDWYFTNNSTRVNVTNNQYKLNLVFERGYLVFRVRAVGTNKSNPTYNVYGGWSRPDNGTNPTSGTCSASYYYVTEDHRDGLNWQYTSVYAEEGKKKEVASYYDGSLRGRQTVTKVNTDNTAVAGESVYDYNGRKAIDILPVPLQTPALDYNVNLNVNISGNKYTYADFDYDGTPCTPTTGAMGTASGAGRYYSPSNPLTTGQNAYIPDANGFPFSQVEYTPDNTGRIRRQSGVGSSHKLGSNHETKYYYGQPNQVELDRLFGSEVGYARHYKKNMVVDPNGQISISYLDQEGRVIATALSGQKPDNMGALSLFPTTPETINVDLFAKDANEESYLNIPDISYTALEFNTWLLVSEPGDHEFNYGITPLIFNEEDLDCMDELCFDCKYDLTITIRDQCGTVVTQQEVTVGGPTLNTTCTTAYFSEALDPFTVNLAIGNYHITKTLTVNKEAYEYYLSEFLKPENNSCITSFATLLEQEENKLDYDGCEITCQDCSDALGTKDEYVLAGKGTEEEWQDEYDRCWAACRGVDICESTYHMMLQDMAPGGQYAEYYDTIKNVVSIADFPLSILNEFNELPDGGAASSSSGSAYWRNPQMEVFTGSGSSMVSGYFDEDGVTRSRIQLVVLPDNGGYYPAANSTFTVDGITYAYPENLTDPRDFIIRWKSSWSYSLVYYHPEYCYYKWCNANVNKAIEPYGKTSTEFDEYLLGLETWDDAETALGTLTSMTTILDADPYLNEPTRTLQKSDMQNKLTNWEPGLSAINVSSIMIQCPGFYGTAPPLPPTCSDPNSATTAQKDEIWETYRALYLSYKTKIMAQDADAYVNNSENCNRGVNSCIGISNFIFSQSPLAETVFNTVHSQPCAANTFRLYEKKNRRFDLHAAAAFEIDQNKADFNRYYMEKTCPMDMDLLNLMNELLTKNSFMSATGTALYQYKSFTPRLHEEILLPGSPGATYGEWDWKTTINSVSELQVDFTSLTMGTAVCGLKITLPGGYDWNSIVITKLHTFKYISYNSGTGVHIFTLQAIVSGVDNPIKITFETCFRMNTCAFSDDCRVTDFGNSMANLLSALATNGHLSSLGAVNLETPYGNYLTRFVRNNIGGGTSNNLEWIHLGGGSFYLRQVGSVVASDNIQVTFTAYDPVTFTSAQIGQIKYFTDFTYEGSSLSQGFVVTAWYSPTGLPPYSSVKIQGTITRGRIGLCYDPVPAHCDNIKLQVTRDFEAWLQEVIQNHPTTNQNLLQSNSFTALMESYTGKASTTTLIAPVYDDNRISTQIEVRDASNDLISKCSISLYRKNTMGFSSFGSLANATDMGLLHTDGTGTFQGDEHNFTVVLEYPSGENEEVYGYVSCLPLEDCIPCRAPIDISVYTLDCPNYEWYAQEVDNFNASGGPTVSTISNSSTFPCDCVKNYLYYLKAWRMSHPTLFNNPGCDTPSTPAPVDLEVYATTYNCQMSFCNECTLWSIISWDQMDPQYLQRTWSSSPNAVLLVNTVNAFNAFFGGLVPPPSWYSTLVFTPDSIGDLDCECAIKYAVYLNRWLNMANAEYPFAGYPDFAPVPYSKFKANGCDADCWWQYKYYHQKATAASGTPVGYTNKFSCDCWLRFTDHTNLATHTPAQILNFCGPKIPPFSPGLYTEVDFDLPLTIRQKVLDYAENIGRAPNECETEYFPLEDVPENPCSNWLDEVAYRNAEIRYKLQMDGLIKSFTAAYYKKCMGTFETFTLEYPSRDYHYTLYYYDQAGNLVRTVPPAGVKVVKNSTDFERINFDRTNKIKAFYTEHYLSTVYEYNSLNQLMKQSVPDHDKMDRWTISATSGVPTGFVPTDMQFLNGNEGLMTGTAGGITYILRTDNAGATWYREGDIYASDIVKVAMATNTVGYAIGKGGFMMKTTDGGANWQILALNNRYSADLNDIVVRQNGSVYEGYIGGDGSVFDAFSDNGTITWTNVTLPGGITGDIISLSFKETTTGTGYALVDVGTEAKLIGCSVWGGAWSIIDLSTRTRSATLNATYMLDASNGYAAGEDGILLKTVNGGVAWTLKQTGITTEFVQIFFPTDGSLVNKGIALGADGKLYLTTTGGESWTAASAIGNYKAFHFWSTALGKGFGVGDDGLISKIEWFSGELKVIKLAPATPITDDLTSVWFSGVDDGLVAGISGAMFKVSQASTQPLVYEVSNTPSANFTAVYMNSTTLGVAVAGGALYRVDIAAGTTGTPPVYTGTFTTLSGVGDNYIDLDANGSNIYALNRTGAATEVDYYTASNPVNPPTATLSASVTGADGPIQGMCAFNSGELLLVGELGTIYRYSSGWSNNSVNTKPGELNNVKAVSATNQVWLAGPDGNLFVSNDNSTTFSQVVGGTAAALTEMDFYAANDGFILASDNDLLNVNGSTVTLVTTSDPALVQDVIATGPGDGVVVTNSISRAVLITNDGGATFTGIYPGGLLLSGKHLTTAVRTAGGSLVALGTGATSLTANSSNVFSRSYTSPPSINSLHVNEAEGMAVGVAGSSLKTSNKGSSWHYNGQIALTGTTYVDVNKVWVQNSAEAYLVGNSGFAKKMHTDATTITNLTFSTSPGSTHLKAVGFNEYGDGIMVGDNFVYQLPTGTTTWDLVHTATSGVVLNDAEVQGDYAIAVGDNGKVFRSENFTTSATFSAVSTPTGTTTTNFRSITMYDRSRAYIMGAAGVLLKTVDWGGSWVQKFSDLGGTNTSNNLCVLALSSRERLTFAGVSGYTRRVDDQADFASAMFWYDRLGRMVVSQNTKQFNKITTKAYSYTLYDALGRISEVGEKGNNDPIETTLSGRQIDDGLLSSWIAYGGSSTRTEVTATFYDAQMAPTGELTQNNLKKRVSAVYYMDVHTSISSGATSGFQHATYYNYDVHGNVDHMVQDIPALSAVNNQYKHIYYDYDLISGKVNQVDYSPGSRDEYHHRYTYDADNRIVMVETSKDEILWDKDGNYEYYKHGPLARSEVGDLLVQGLDYSYTIQGWIKGVNSNTMDEDRDPGKDGVIGNAHEDIGRDAFGYTLGYFSGDYEDIAGLTTANRFEADITGSDLAAEREDLWNGNISSMVTCLPKASDYNSSKTITPEAFGNAYNYDQLNRISSSRTFTNLDYTNNEWEYTGGAAPTAYATDYTYDAMGNILTQKRNGPSGGVNLDDLTYVYDWNYQKMSVPETHKKLVSNRLYHVLDNVTSSAYTDDIDDQGSVGNNTATLDTTTEQTFRTTANYAYDELGNLIRDDQEKIANIEWTVYGKIKSVTRIPVSTDPTSLAPDLEFGYDAGGNRLWKKVKPKPLSSATEKIYYYLRDAQGNEMCRYEEYTNSSSQVMYVAEEHAIYGSSRLGLDNRRDTLYKAGSYAPAWFSNNKYQRDLGLKAYELSNHLGNVLVTVTDKKVYKVSSGNIYFEAEITSITDYYPFGSVMQGRVYSSGAYRYGFNGKEKEADGTTDNYDFGARIYDGRLGRWLSVDRLLTKYSEVSTFCFAGNTPLNSIDPDGRLIIFINGYYGFPTRACCGGTVQHWGEWWIKAVQKHVGDYNAMFFDGSVGGTAIQLKNDPAYRWVKGYEEGAANASYIIAGLHRNEAGYVDEPIRFVTSSMGAAYERGFSLALVEEVNKQNEVIDKINNAIKADIANVKKLQDDLAKDVENGKITVDEAIKINDEYDQTIADYEGHMQKNIELNIEWVIDLDSHQWATSDPQAEHSFYMRSDDKTVNFWAKAMVDRPAQIDGAIFSGTMKDHHPSWAPVDKMPQGYGLGAGDKDNPTYEEHPRN